MTFDPMVPVWVLVALVAGSVVLAVARWRRGAPVLAAAGGVVVAMLLAAVAVDPAVGGGSAPTITTSADVLFAVDTTTSISAEDYDGTSPRLDGVRADITEIAAEFAGGRFSLITFDATATVELPWTTDAAALDAAVRVLRPELSYYSAGTRLDVPVEAIGDALDRSASDDEGRQRILVVFSDGEQTQPGDIGAYASLAERIDAGAVLGYGTTEGGRMLDYWGVYGSDSDYYVYDYATNNDAVSHADPDTLAEIASHLGVEYRHRERPGGLATWASDVSARSVEVDGGSSREGARRLYWFPAIGLLAIACAQFGSVAAALLDDRRMFAPRGRP